MQGKKEKSLVAAKKSICAVFKGAATMAECLGEKKRNARVAGCIVRWRKNQEIGERKVRPPVGTQSGQIGQSKRNGGLRQGKTEKMTGFFSRGKQKLPESSYRP